MANSLAFCQQYHATLLRPLLKSKDSIIYAYMDDLILGHQDPAYLEGFVTQVLQLLKNGALL